MTDLIFSSFLAVQHQMARAFAMLNPGLVELQALTPCHWLAHFHCKGLIRTPGGPVREADHFVVGIGLGPDYCRKVEPGVITMLTPHVFSPHVAGPHVCAGRLAPATPLTDLLVQTFEILTWRNVVPNDPLNREAAEWARNHPDRIPLEPFNSRKILMPRRDSLPPENMSSPMLP